MRRELTRRGSSARAFPRRLETTVDRRRLPTTVRQQPLIAMLSPVCASAAIRGSRITSRTPGGSGDYVDDFRQALDETGEHW